MAELSYPAAALPLPASVSTRAYTGPYGDAAQLPPLVRGRTDYITGVLGLGIGRVRGETVELVGAVEVPVQRKLRLHRERDGLLIRELWSNPITGAYSFDYVDELQKYTTLAYDHTGALRAVVADGQIPELMP